MNCGDRGARRSFRTALKLLTVRKRERSTLEGAAAGFAVLALALVEVGPCNERGEAV